MLAVWVAAGLGAPLASGQSARPDWYAVARCETGSGGPPKWDWGSKHRPKEGSTYEGGVGFYWGTWRLWAGQLHLLARYPHAYDAPAVVQIAVAEHGWEHGGYWGCLH